MNTILSNHHLFSWISVLFSRRADRGHTCPLCGGTGYLPKYDPKKEEWYEVTCRRCGGSGVVND